MCVSELLQHCAIRPNNCAQIKKCPFGSYFPLLLIININLAFRFHLARCERFPSKAEIYLSVYDLQQYIIYLLDLTAVASFSKECNNLTPSNISCTSKGSSSIQPVKCSPQDLICQSCYSCSSDVPNDPWTCEQVWRIMRRQMLVTDHNLQSLIAHLQSKKNRVD